MKKATAEEIAWAAGLFEGEGSFSNPGCASLKMTDMDSVAKFRDIVGFGSVIWNPGRKEGWKDTWKWRVSNRMDFELVLDMFWPWLSLRRRQRAMEILIPASERIEGSKATCGTVSKYAVGCRCRPCRKANSLYQMDYRRRRGAHRKGPRRQRVRLTRGDIRLIVTRGWTVAEVMDRYGCCRETAIKYVRLARGQQMSLF